jgi:hypothetical protein
MPERPMRTFASGHKHESAFVNSETNWRIFRGIYYDPNITLGTLSQSHPGCG